MFSLWHNLPFGWGVEAYCDKNLAIVKSASIIKCSLYSMHCIYNYVTFKFYTYRGHSVTPCVYAENSEKYLVHI